MVKKLGYRDQFEDGLQALVSHFVEQATQQCTQQVKDLTAQIDTLHRRWPIVGTDEVKVLRRLVHEQVGRWFDQSLADLTVARAKNSAADIERHMVARLAAHNALYRAINERFQIPELKALPKEEVPAVRVLVRRTLVPIDIIWRAVVKKAIAQRLAFWLKRGFLADTPSAIQGARQHLWHVVRTSGLRAQDGEFARRRILRTIDRAALPQCYRQVK